MINSAELQETVNNWNWVTKIFAEILCLVAEHKLIISLSLRCLLFFTQGKVQVVINVHKAALQFIDGKA